VSGFSRTSTVRLKADTTIGPCYANRVPRIFSLVTTDDLAPNVDSDGAVSRITSVAVVIGALAAIVAGATIWLLLTDPVTVLNAVDEGQVSPLVRQLADILYNALAGLLDYL